MTKEPPRQPKRLPPLLCKEGAKKSNIRRDKPAEIYTFMKLRIKSNTVRFRLLRSEVERLAAAGVMMEEIRFGASIDQVLKYSIAVSDGVEQLTVQFTDSQILVLLPESAAMNWTQSDEVGIEAVVQIDENDSLHVLIEKDFVCLDRPDDLDRDDAFPHPGAEC